MQEIQLSVRHWSANHEVWFVAKKAALRSVANQRTEPFQSELALAIEALQRMQEDLQQELKLLAKLVKN